MISQAEIKLAGEMLESLYEIEFAIGEYKDRVRDGDQQATSTFSPIQSSINFGHDTEQEDHKPDREYI